MPWTHDMVGSTLVTRQPKAAADGGYEEVPTRRVHTYGRVRGFVCVYVRRVGSVDRPHRVTALQPTNQPTDQPITQPIRSYPTHI